MALSKQHEDRFGNTHSSAYYKVDRITMDIGKTAEVTVCVYKDQAARDAGKSPINKTLYYYNVDDNYTLIFGAVEMDNKNPLRGIYDDLKTRPDFTGAADV